MPKGKWCRFTLRVLLPIVAIIGICIYSYIQHGFTWRMLFPVLMFTIGYLYFGYGLNILGRINFLLWFPTGLSLWLSFLLWDPSEHLPFGSDMEYPHSAGLSFGMGMGFIVLMVRASYEDDGPFLKAIRTMRHYPILLSSVVVAGYTMFLLYSLAMYLAFSEGHYIFVLLAIFSVVAFLAFAHNKARSPLVEK